MFSNSHNSCNELAFVTDVEESRSDFLSLTPLTISYAQMLLSSYRCTHTGHKKRGGGFSKKLYFLLSQFVLGIPLCHPSFFECAWRCLLHLLSRAVAFPSLTFMLNKFFWVIDSAGWKYRWYMWSCSVFHLNRFVVKITFDWIGEKRWLVRLF